MNSLIVRLIRKRGGRVEGGGGREGVFLFRPSPPTPSFTPPSFHMDFQDYPQPEKSNHFKLIAIITGGLILAGGIIAGVVYYTGKDPVTLSFEQTEKIRNMEEGVGKEEDLCKALEGVSKDDCLWGVAKEKNDPSLCETMTDKDLVVRCKDGIIWDIAVQASDAPMCDKISDDGLKNGCQERIKGPITSENCVARRGEAYCEVQRVVELARVAQDEELCDQLKEDQERYSCQDLVEINDPDFDGLDSLQETDVYFTNPRNADTDGDGYKDGEEVQAGYDPLKK